MGLIRPVSAETALTLVQRQNAETAENKAFSTVAALEIERFELKELARQTGLGPTSFDVRMRGEGTRVVDRRATR